MKEFNLVYVSTASFWKNACIKPYQHHDYLFKYLNRIMPLKIHIAVPMSGDTYFKNLVETGNDSRVMSTWKQLPYKVYPGLYTGEMDGLFINGNGATWDKYTLCDGSEVNAEQMCNYIVNLAIQCRENNLPVILHDPDNFVNFVDGKENKVSNKLTNYTYRVYNLLKDYDKFTMSSPFEFGSAANHPGELFIPFTLDKEIRTPIKPYEDREFFTRYVGSNYYRDHFVDYFKKCTQFGRTQVAGSGWSWYQKNVKEPIEWKHKFPLTTENVYDVYSDMKIALYGTSKVYNGHGHYTLRIREFYEAGVFVIPEDYDYMINSICLDGRPYTIQDLMNDKSFDFIKQDYEALVDEQREKLIKKFDAQQYAEIIADCLSK